MIVIQDLLKPTATITINGVDVADDFVECSVTLNGHQEADSFTLTVPDTIKTYIDLSDFYKEKVEVSLGYYMYQGGVQRKVVRKIISGYTDSKRFSIGKDTGNVITLEGRNLTGFLVDATDTQAYINQTVEQIIKDQARLALLQKQRYGIPDGLKRTAYGSPQDGYGVTFEIDNTSIWETMTRLASDLGLCCKIDSDETFYFGVYESETSYKFVFNFDVADDGNVIEFVGSLQCPNAFHHKCQIVGHNDEGMEVIYGEATHIPSYLAGGNTVKGAIQLRTLKVANDLAITREMAETQAMMRLWENQRDIMTVQLGSQYGIPYVSPGHLIQIEHCDYPLFNRDFWIRNITHTINKESGYRMDIFAEVPPYGWNITEIGTEVGVVF